MRGGEGVSGSGLRSGSDGYYVMRREREVHVRPVALKLIVKGTKAAGRAVLEDVRGVGRPRLPVFIIVGSGGDRAPLDDGQDAIPTDRGDAEDGDGAVIVMVGGGGDR